MMSHQENTWIRKKILELFTIDMIIMMVWHIIHINIVHIIVKFVEYSPIFILLR